jgi:hypothetical protein
LIYIVAISVFKGLSKANAEYRSHLINTILNSKSLSKEIYNKLSSLEDLEVDSIKGISKWKSDMETDINFNIFDKYDIIIKQFFVKKCFSFNF